MPLLDLRPQYEELRAEIGAALARVSSRSSSSSGPEVDALEREIAAYCGAPEAIAVGSGSDAILLALMALGIGPGDQVICPTYTFFATAGCVARLGAEPIFADVDPATFNIDRRGRRARRAPLHGGCGRSCRSTSSGRRSISKGSSRCGARSACP